MKVGLGHGFPASTPPRRLVALNLNGRDVFCWPLRTEVQLRHQTIEHFA
jgi:hypothetical protein